MKTPQELITERTISHSHDVLNIKIYRSSTSFICEHQQIERDGTETIQCVVFDSVKMLSDFFESDPLYKKHQKEFDSIIQSMRKLLGG
jgi:hypothetical protein